MTNVRGGVTEEVPNTIALGHSVYDKQGKKVGTVDMVDRSRGYFTVQARPSPEKRESPFREKIFHVPFRLITTIDPRELYLSVSRDELDRDYGDPPLRFTSVEDEGEGRVATTKEKSGYTGAPIVVERVKVEQMKDRIAPGDHVFTADMIDLGTITRYDPLTGWMLVEHGLPWSKHDLMVPVTLVEDVNRDGKEVYLVASQADLRRMQHLEPVSVVFAEAKFREGS